MGCPASGCVGYELTASLDFDTNGDGSVTTSGDTYWNSGSGWEPIGDDNVDRYSGDFKGNGHTINNLFINRSTTHIVGLFGVVNTISRIETLGVTNANVTGNQFSGILFGASYGEIVACYTTGKVHGTNYVGGLGGFVQAASSTGIFSSYSTAYVNGTSRVGGLIGRLAGGSTTHSYSTGRVNRSSGTATTIGGLIGSIGTIAGSVTASYWDTSTSGQSTSAGGSGVVGKTTRQLQTPTGYNGIYANWNANLDGVTGNDDPWAFGSKTQYPMLDYKGMSTNPQNSQAMGKPDNWNAPIVGEPVRVRLTSAAFQNRNGKWIWEKSANGDAWETISGSRSPTYIYIPTTADVNHYLRAKVGLSGSAFAYTRALGGRVKNASGATAGSAISFVSGNASPRVGTAIVASDPRPTGAVDARIGWQRCPNATAPHTDCVYILDDSWCAAYTPVAADVGNYLRMYIYYETSAGVWTRHVSAFTGQVAASQ